MFVNSLSIYRYRQCMRIYSSGVLRVRFDRVSINGILGGNNGKEIVAQSDAYKYAYVDTVEPLSMWKIAII
ncbi:unnamed protein product [Cylicostephanus goldi]|uniref:Uncharacterized protein n=1 Tax=Cylicostephanus goldi TaxID=71465 RepID=A0A3P6TTL1_CYLGO|nr:unnamed protein product [Cylicostephanus goldi]